ncbi:hypothetical protein [Kineococcus sp. SYSU DK005]|uniref:hypothetical protein n=1 Tax=Kineococcus sp. SYSU DK005 TaxID=3383126 RepID=UPI003D7EA909
MSFTWWRTDPAGRRLLLVGSCALVLAVLAGLGTWALLLLAARWWLVHRAGRGGRVAWALLVVFSVLGVLSSAGVVLFLLPASTPPPPVIVLPMVLNAAIVVLLATPAVRVRVNGARTGGQGTRAAGSGLTEDAAARGGAGGTEGDRRR